MTDLKKLRDLAAKATQGRWEIKISAAGQYRIWLYAKSIIRLCQFNTQINRHNDAAYIAAADPATVTELIDTIDALTRERDKLAIEAKAGRSLAEFIVCECDGDEEVRDRVSSAAWSLLKQPHDTSTKGST